MNDHDLTRRPGALDAILNDTNALGFTMALVLRPPPEPPAQSEPPK